MECGIYKIAQPGRARAGAGAGAREKVNGRRNRAQLNMVHFMFIFMLSDPKV